MVPRNSTTAAMTTSTPRIVGYQRPLCSTSLARIVDTFLLLQRSLVGHDRLDLFLREHGAEVRHAARGDAPDSVLLVGRDTDADPPEQLGLTARRRELVVHVTPGEIGTIGAATHRTGCRVGQGVGRIEVRPAPRVAAGAVVHEQQ